MRQDCDRRTLQSGWAEAQALSGTAYIGLAYVNLLEYRSRLDINVHGVENSNFGQKSEIPRAAQPINIQIAVEMIRFVLCNDCLKSIKLDLLVDQPFIQVPQDDRFMAKSNATHVR